MINECKFQEKQDQQKRNFRNLWKSKDRLYNEKVKQMKISVEEQNKKKNQKLLQQLKERENKHSELLSSKDSNKSKLNKSFSEINVRQKNARKKVDENKKILDVKRQQTADKIMTKCNDILITLLSRAI